MTEFYLGTHKDCWLKRTAAPLFVSRRTLAPRRTLPRALGPWALDSGGFTELQMYGRWTLPPADYAAEARRFRDEVGGLRWAAPQDWMCEPIVLAGGRAGPIRFAGTGLSVAEHQRRTVDNFRELRSLAPDVPWVPVLQGWEPDDYRRCEAMYDRAGVDLRRERAVGVGSVCRRQGTDEAGAVFRALAPLGLRLHGFGLKLKGLERFGHLLASADSMAWSKAARYDPPLAGCTHRNCANCMRYALAWRGRVIGLLGRRRQGEFDFEAMLDLLAAFDVA